MPIIITVLLLILLGIVVGSNLLPSAIVVVLNQPTIALPIGIWLSLAIGAGLLTSIAIQMLLTFDRRQLKRQIRQLQTRLRQQDEDVFTYAPATPTTDSKSADGTTDPTPPRKHLFNSYRMAFNDRFSQQKATERPSIVDNEDDWDARPRSRQQLDWEDSFADRSPNLHDREERDSSETARRYSAGSDSTIGDRDEQNRSQVYDADFRLIQPPYKKTPTPELEDEEEEYFERDDDRDFDSPASSFESSANDRHRASTNLDDEDWGFDFDNDDAPVKAK